MTLTAERVERYFRELSVELTRDGGDLEQRLDGFFSTLSLRLRLLADARRQMDVYLASHFSAFRLFPPDERGLSEVIAELLRPAGRHGQGAHFW